MTRPNTSFSRHPLTRALAFVAIMLAVACLGAHSDLVDHSIGAVQECWP